MQKAVFLVFTLILGWTCSSQALVLPEPLYPTQENFDLTRFLGTWHDIAVAKTCLPDCPAKDSAIGKLVLQKGSAEDELQMTRTVLKNGTCKHKSGVYNLTLTPGRFRFAKSDAEVDAYVVHTNYEEYALMVMMKERSSGQNCTTVKLYSRTMDVRATVLDDFRTLVEEQEISSDNVVFKQNKGDCVPGEQVEEPIVVEKVKRDVELDEMEFDGSGDDTLMFNGSDLCHPLRGVQSRNGGGALFWYTPALLLQLQRHELSDVQLWRLSGQQEQLQEREGVSAEVPH
ncbi:protein AMBP isoform X3 [Syngnathus typhle]|uniref:protein AMBP isoform X3 n=1 Tax=Syngnathus typhle TaxID=161592 RepID=UPI002A69BFBE|nr:protein AMBP isoform X3 [Syngnathus typhle]